MYSRNSCSVTGDYYTAERSDITWVKTVLSFLASFIGLATFLFVDDKAAFISCNFTLLQRRHKCNYHATCIMMLEIQVKKWFLFL